MDFEKRIKKLEKILLFNQVLLFIIALNILQLKSKQISVLLSKVIKFIIQIFS